jgi:cupin fold WbuC family metalloprotein
VTTFIDHALLDAVCREAAASPRRRKNRNFHTRDDQPGHRLLNAMQPDSYIPPHRHLDPDKGETMVVLRGLMALFEFDADGKITRITKVGAGGTALGVDIPPGTWHTVVALEADTVFLEAKAGPYLPLIDKEKAPWAPAENLSQVAPYLEVLKAALSG